VCEYVEAMQVKFKEVNPMCLWLARLYFSEYPPSADIVLIP